MILSIGKTKIILEDKGKGQGQITIQDAKYGNYEMYWGAMGDNKIAEFIEKINSHYFTSKLLKHRSGDVFCHKKTFAALRRYIRNDMNLPWYKHMFFQQDLREKLASFQERCVEYDSSQYFVDHFYFFINDLNYNRIEDRWTRGYIESEFKEITEPWHFIGTKESDEAKWLRQIHAKLKKGLNNL